MKEVKKEELFSKGDKALIDKKFAEASKIYGDLVTAYPDSIEAWNKLGETYTYLQKFQKALECFDKVLSLDENFTMAIVNKGVVYVHLKKEVTALKYFDAALVQDKDNIHALVNKGDLFIKYFQKPNEALKFLERAKDLEPQTPEVWEALGEAYQKLRVGSVAEMCFENAQTIRAKKRKQTEAPDVMYA